LALRRFRFTAASFFAERLLPPLEPKIVAASDVSDLSVGMVMELSFTSRQFAKLLAYSKLFLASSVTLAGAMKHTFGGLLGQWLAQHTAGRRAGTQKFNREIAATIRQHWPGALNGVATIVTSDEVTRFAERVAHFCPSRWNAMVSALRFITPAARALKRRRLVSKQRALLSQLEFNRLLEECDRLPRSRAGLVVRFLAQTGLRIGEAQQLRWADVKSDHFTVSGQTKNGEARSVPFVPGIEETLQRLRSLCDAEFVLPRERVRRGLSKACDRAGLPRLSHHDFRHLFATRCVQSGVDLPTVARWLGHRDGGALLAKRYFHLVDEHSRQMAKKVRV
jgi:integrase